MELNDPKIKIMAEMEKERLQRGIIDWEYVLSPIIKKIDDSKKSLFHDYSFSLHQSLIDQGVIIGPVMTKEEWEESVKREKEEDKLRLSEAREKLAQAIALMRDKERVSKIESLSKEIAEWPDETRSAPHWKEVAGCLLKFPDSVKLESGICPKCGDSTFECHFSTAEYLQALNVGFGGEMTICPHCHFRDFRQHWII